MSETKTYTGSCHCGAVAFEVRADLSSASACNCSICSRVGWRLAFVPAAAFTLKSGEDALVDYQFGRKTTHHPFCRHCGVRSFSRGKGPSGDEMVAVNVRCLEGVDAESLPVNHFDGKSL